MNSNLQIRLLMRALLSPQPGCTAGAGGTGGRTRNMLRRRACQRRLRDACAPCLRLEPLCCPQGSGLAGSPRKHCPAGDRKLNCSPLRWHPSCRRSAGPKSGVIRGPQWQRGGPAGSSHPLRSPSLTWSGGWTWLWLCFAARLFLGIATDRRCRERAGCGAGACWELCWGAQRGARRCRQLGAGTLPLCR